jgi:hypothetical protein
MPVRSLKQSVWRWPAPEQVLQRVGVFGSCGRGTAAFGSDLDLILVDALARGGQIERLQQWPLADLPLSCDALVLTPAELEQCLNDGSRMASGAQARPALAALSVAQIGNCPPSKASTILSTWCAQLKA